jgi:hypothetical protein
MRLHKCRGYFLALIAKANSVYSNRISISLANETEKGKVDMENIY